MSRTQKHIIGWTLIAIGSVAVGQLIAYQDNTKADQGGLFRSLIEKDISNFTKALIFLAQNKDKVWYESDKLNADLQLEGAKLELQGNFKAAIESYQKALKVPLYEMPNYDAYLPLGRAYIQNGEKPKAISALNAYKEKASYDIANEFREWTLSAEGKENITKRIEICNKLLSLLQNN